MEIKSKYSIGDFVDIDGYTSFCTSHVDKVKDIKVAYEEKTGKSYNVIVCSDDNEYREDTGESVKGAEMYFLVGVADMSTPSKHINYNIECETVVDRANTIIQ